MIKETYKVKCPHFIAFGDPMYFDEFKEKKLKSLVVNDKIPKHLDTARVILEEFPFEADPNENIYLMTIYIAPRQTINTYVGGQMYSVQELFNKDIGVDTACYLLQIDKQYDEFRTGSDGYWGEYVEYFRKIEGKKIVDAIRIEVGMTFYEQNMEDMRRTLNYFFENIEQIENLPDPE